ncbi:MAG: hypothetical protein GY853_06035 [PVC group bacterium]|nr:hypothetical protein [PVC group bacterium]
MQNDNQFIIFVRLDDGEPRVCDYCNTLLVNEKGVTAEECFSTDYGLMCLSCLGGIRPLLSYQRGHNVKNESWYQGF